MTPREGGEPVAWAVVDRDGCMWKAREVKASMEHERDALNAYVDTGHYKACGPYTVVPLYAHPAATAREEAIRAEVIEECAKVCEAPLTNGDVWNGIELIRTPHGSATRGPAATDGEKDAARKILAWRAAHIRALALARSVKGTEA